MCADTWKDVHNILHDNKLQNYIELYPTIIFFKITHSHNMYVTIYVEKCLEEQARKWVPKGGWDYQVNLWASWHVHIMTLKYSHILPLVGENIDLLKMDRGAIHNN